MQEQDKNIKINLTSINFFTKMIFLLRPNTFKTWVKALLSIMAVFFPKIKIIIWLVAVTSPSNSIGLKFSKRFAS